MKERRHVAPFFHSVIPHPTFHPFHRLSGPQAVDFLLVSDQAHVCCGLGDPMKKSLLVILIAITATDLRAQGEANNWYFGLQAGITFENGFPQFLPGSQMAPSEGCASLS